MNVSKKIPNRGASLKFLIIIPIAVLIVSLTAMTSWNSYLTASATVSDFIDSVSSEMISELEIVTITYLSDIDIVLNAFSSNGQDRLSPVNFKNDEYIEQRLWGLSEISPTVTNVAMGRTNGEFIGIRRLKEDKAIRRLKEYKAIGIKNSNYKNKTIFVAAKPGDRIKIHKIDSEFETLSSEWYKNAIRIGQVTWSPIFKDTTKNKLVITRSKPIKDSSNNIMGVVVSDKTLDQLGYFLTKFKKSKLSPNSEAFIFEKNGDFIADTTTLNSALNTEYKTSRTNGSQSPSKLIRKGSEYVNDNLEILKSNDVVTKILKINGESVHFAFKKIQGLEGLDWYIVVLAPENDFNKNFIAATRKTIYIAGGSLLLIIFLIMTFLNFSLYDLEVLTQASRNFGAGKDPGVLLIERNDEIGVLANSFNNMVAEIKIHQKELEDKVKERTKDLAKKNNQLEEEINKRKVAQEKILQLFSALELSDDAMAVFDPDQTVKFINPAFMRLSGYNIQDMEAEEMKLFKSGRMDPSQENTKILNTIKRRIDNGKTFRGVVRKLKKNGELYNCEMTLTPILNKQNELIAFNLIERDVTLKEKAKEVMMSRLRTDKLTDLLNRDALLKDVNDKFIYNISENAMTNISENTVTNINVNAVTKNNSCFAVIYMDLNKFKEVNDTLGHDYGDVTLIVAGLRMKSCLSTDDLLARLGGDEFVAVIKNVNSKEEAIAMGQKIEKNINLPMQIKDKKVEIGVSFGVALYPNEGTDLDTLLRVADEEMYKAKRSSRTIVPALKAG